jgi:formyltetrahydrofolate deformylase
MGTVAAVTGFIAAHRLYIMEMQQFDDLMTKRFFVRITFCTVAGETLDLARLRKDFVRSTFIIRSCRASRAQSPTI